MTRNLDAQWACTQPGTPAMVSRYAAIDWKATTVARSFEFEVFKRTSVPLTRDPAVTIQFKGSLSLNKAAYVAIGSPEAVELLFDRRQQVIGIKPVDPGTPHAYTPRPAVKKEDTGPFLIAGKAFAAYFKIDTARARRYPATVEDGVLLVDLKQPETRATGSQDRATNGAATG